MPAVFSQRGSHQSVKDEQCWRLSSPGADGKLVAHPGGPHWSESSAGEGAWCFHPWRMVLSISLLFVSAELKSTPVL